MKNIKAEKNNEIKKIGIIGDGHFAEALAYLISKVNKDVEIVLWAYEEGKERDGKNGDTFQYSKREGKEMPLPENVRITHNAQHVVVNSEVLFSVLPAQYTREAYEGVFKDLIEVNWDNIKAIISGTKGIEKETNQLISEVLQSVFDSTGRKVLEKMGVISGLTFSEDIINDRPVGANIVSESEDVQKIGLDLLKQEGEFDVLPQKGVRSAEIFGALKNVIAIATGAAEGLKYEGDAIEELIAAGVSEINRFATALEIDHKSLGKNDYTMLDLVGTAKSFKSRNFQTGFSYTNREEAKDMGVSEGVETVKSVIALAKEKNIKMPICEAVYEMFGNKKDISQILESLLKKLEVLKRASQIKVVRDRKKKKKKED